ncbi:cytochrome-c peroxidase [Thiolapillus sp.]
METLYTGGRLLKGGWKWIACSLLGSAAADPVVEPVQVLEPWAGLNPGIVALGERLFHDMRLSADNTVSCAHCHRLGAGGSDNLPVSVGIRGQLGVINAPTVYNLNTHVSYFWDGRALTLENLVQGPLRNIREMGTDWPEVLAKLEKDEAMADAFRKAFPEKGMTPDTISRALADFMRSLVALDSPMDRWLRGEKDALSEQELRGYRLFKNYGCIACHQGQAVGGNMYASMGVMGDYFGDRKRPLTRADRGRFNVTGEEEDMHVFKVPSLRMVVLTAPYFHDASADTLEEAIATMARYQLGRDIPAEDIRDIKAFFHSLLGRHPLLRERE